MAHQTAIDDDDATTRSIDAKLDSTRVRRRRRREGFLFGDRGFSSTRYLPYTLNTCFFPLYNIPQSVLVVCINLLWLSRSLAGTLLYQVIAVLKREAFDLRSLSVCSSTAHGSKPFSGSFDLLFVCSSLSPSTGHSGQMLNRKRRRILYGVKSAIACDSKITYGAHFAPIFLCFDCYLIIYRVLVSSLKQLYWQNAYKLYKDRCETSLKSVTLFMMPI